MPNPYLCIYDTSQRNFQIQFMLTIYILQHYVTTLRRVIVIKSFHPLTAFGNYSKIVFKKLSTVYV